MPSAKATIIPLSTGQEPGSASWWETQLNWSTEIRKDKLKGWRINARAYCGELEPPIKRPENISVNIEFEKTEQKKPQLFYRLPALKLRPSPRTIRDSQPPPAAFGMAQVQPRDLKRAVAIFREVLSRLAGPKGANTQCPAGIGFCKIGYERYENGTIPVATGDQQPDPKYQQPGAVLGLRPTPMVPVMQDAPNVIAEKYYASRISPANGLIPAEFRGSDYSETDWLGYDGWITPEEAKRRGWPVPARLSITGSGTDDDDDRIMVLDKKGSHRGQLRYRVIYYYAARVDADVKHPDKIRQLVFIGDQKDPVVHCDFKDQRFDARGRFAGGLRRNPIKVVTLRYVSDLAYPPSDCQITRGIANELSELRTQQVIHRRRAVPMRWIDIDSIIDDKVKDAIKRGEYYDILPTSGPGDRFMGEIAKANYPAENWKTHDALMNDANRAWALGANQSSVTEAGSTTATEIGAIAQATATRLGGERDKVVSRFWVEIMQDLGALYQLYGDHEDYVEILGEDGAKTVEAFTNQDVLGEFLYSVVPNSSLAPDAAADRDLALNRYNLVRNDPCINPEQLLRDTLDAYDVPDIDRLVHPIMPANTPQEKPRLTVSVKGEDLNPSAPQYANVVALLTAIGIPPNVESAPSAVTQATPPGTDVTPAPVVDRERLRMAATDNKDQRAGGLVGMGTGGR